MQIQQAIEQEVLGGIKVITYLYLGTMAILVPIYLLMALQKIVSGIQKIVQYCEWHARIEQRRYEKQFPNEPKRSELR